MLAAAAPMLIAGIILLIVGLAVAVTLNQAREIGVLAAVGGIILIVLHYVGVG